MMYIRLMSSETLGSRRNSQVRRNAVFSEKFGGNEKNFRRAVFGHGIPFLHAPYSQTVRVLFYLPPIYSA